MMVSNGQMGVLNLEKNGIFLTNSFNNASSMNGVLISLKPNFCIGLSTKKEKRFQIINVRSSNCGVINALPKKEVDRQSTDDGFLEKEFRFRPAFEEYLKVMESARAGKHENSMRDDERDRPKKSSIMKDSNVKSIDKVEKGKDKKTQEFGKCDGITDQIDELHKKDKKGTSQNASRRRLGQTGRDGDLGGPSKSCLYKKSNGIESNSEGFPKKDTTESRQISSSGKLDFGQSYKDWLDNKGHGLNRKSHGIRGYKIGERRAQVHEANNSQKLQQTERWPKVHVSNAGKKGAQLRISKMTPRSKESYVKSRVDGKDGDEDLGEGKMTFDAHSSEMRKRQLQPNGTQVDERHNVVERINNQSVLENSMLEEKRNRLNAEMIMGKSETNKSMRKGEDLVRNGITKENFQRNDVASNTFQSGNNNSIIKNIKNSDVSKHVLENNGFLRRVNKGKPKSTLRSKHEAETNREQNYVNEGGIGHQGVSHLRWNPCDERTEICELTRSQKHVRLQQDAYGAEKTSPRNTEMPGRLSANYSQAEHGYGYKSSVKNEKFSKLSKLFTEDDGDVSVEMERKAFKTFEVFTDVRGRPRILRMEMEERIEKLAKWLNGTDLNLPQWQFSKMIHSANIKFTDHSILRIVQILGALGNWRRALQIVEWLQSRDRFKSYKSKYIYTTVLNVLGKAMRPVEALNVFHAMRQQLSSYPDLASYHCIAVTLGQAGYLKELFDVIDCMRAVPDKKFKLGMLEKWDPRLEPDIVVYNAVLNACVRRKQWEGAFWVLQQLNQQKIQPSSTTYGLVMEVMLECGKYNLVHEFFRKVEKTSIPNALNYKVLLNTLQREGKTDEAVSIVQDMERRGIVGSASLYYDLARCLCSAGRCQEALEQIDKICKVAKKPLVVTYTGLIQACLDSGSVENGAYIFHQMHKFCSPNVVTCNIMLKAYIDNGMFEEAKDLFQKIIDGTNYICNISDYKDGVIPDKFTFNTMLEACVKEESWDDFENAYEQMLHHGYPFNAKRHLRLILEASRAGKRHSLDISWDHLVQSGRVVPPAMIKERFCMKLQEANVAEAISCIQNHHHRRSPLHSFSKEAWLGLFNANVECLHKDTVVRLVHEVSTLVAESDRPNPIFQGLLSCCREFIDAQTTIAQPTR